MARIIKLHEVFGKEAVIQEIERFGANIPSREAVPLFWISVAPAAAFRQQLCASSGMASISLPRSAWSRLAPSTASELAINWRWPPFQTCQ